MKLKLSKSNLLFTYKEEKVFLFYMIIMTLEGGIEYYSSHGFWWGLLLYRLCAIATLLLSIYFVYKSKIVRRSYSSYLLLYFVLLVGFSVIMWVAVESKNATFFSGFIYFGLLIAIGVSNSKISMETIEKALYVVCIIGVLVFIFVFVSESIDIGYALRRGYVWSDIFYWANVYWGIIPSVLCFFIVDKHKTLVIIYWLLGIIFNMLFLKRFILVDSILLAVMILVFLLAAKKMNFIRFVQGILLVGIVAVVLIILSNTLVGDLYSGILSRFDDTHLNNFDRYIETKNYFTEDNRLLFITGKGFWGTHRGLGITSEALHFGWAAFFLKGGIVFFIIALAPVLKAFSLVPHLYKLDNKTQLAVCILCINAFRLFYLNFHSLNPSLMFFFWAACVVMQFNRKKTIIPALKSKT